MFINSANKLNSTYIKRRKYKRRYLYDNPLIFNQYIYYLCLTVKHRLDTLRRIGKYITLEKTKLLCNPFIKSQFNHDQSIWMCCRREAICKDLKDSPQNSKSVT